MKSEINKDEAVREAIKIFPSYSADRFFIEYTTCDWILENTRRLAWAISGTGLPDELLSMGDMRKELKLFLTEKWKVEAVKRWERQVGAIWDNHRQKYVVLQGVGN